MPRLLSASNVSRQDRSRTRWLLKNISFEIAAGDRIALLGPTGSGKTLLLRALSLLDPIDSGTIRWQERVIRKREVPAFRSQVMYVSQQPALLAGTIEDCLRFPFVLVQRSASHYSRERIVEYLRVLNRDASFLSLESEHLSGGQRQLVVLLRALQLDPQVLLLDEPTAALDAASVGLVERLVHCWQQQAPDTRTLVWVTHDPRQAERVASRLLHLHAGCLQANQE